MGRQEIINNQQKQKDELAKRLNMLEGVQDFLPENKFHIIEMKGVLSKLHGILLRSIVLNVERLEKLLRIMMKRISLIIQMKNLGFIQYIDKALTENK